MSRYTGPKVKKQRRFGLLPESPTDFIQIKKQRKSEYGIRLEEKQKLKFIYGLAEKQFRRYFTQARKNPTDTGLVLLQLLERRLDNIIYRLHFAKTRAAARQLVNHGHVLVNNKVVNVPSYLVKENDMITLKAASLEIPNVKENLEESKDTQAPDWISRKGYIGVVKSLPSREQLRDDIEVQFIIEYYSR